MAVSDLERAIRRGLLGLLEVFRRNNIIIRFVLELCKERFAMRDGVVTVKDAAPPPAPTPAPCLLPVPLPFLGVPSFRNLRWRRE